MSLCMAEGQAGCRGNDDGGGSVALELVGGRGLVTCEWEYSVVVAGEVIQSNVIL